MTTVRDFKKAAVQSDFPDDDDFFHVYIYRNDHGIEITGHTDIAAGNTLISYGCHDPQHRLPFCLKGDGVVIQADRLSFLHHEFVPGELIIDYALKPSPEQIHAFLKKSDSFFTHGIPWNPSGNDDYASCLYRDIHPCFYKLRNHPYSEYNLLHNNCVTFVYDWIRDWLPGYHKKIDTPSSFRDFLNQGWEEHHPLFHSRTIWYQPFKKE